MDRKRSLNALSPDDFVLAFPHVPLVYFLSGTRPYLAETWPVLRTETFLRDRLEWARRTRGRLPVVVRAPKMNLGWIWPAKGNSNRDMWVPPPPSWLRAYHLALRSKVRTGGLALFGFGSFNAMQVRMINANYRTLQKFVEDGRYTRAWRGKGPHALEILVPPAGREGKR